MHVACPVSEKAAEASGEVIKAAANRKAEAGARTCREGHIADGYGLLPDEEMQVQAGLQSSESKAMTTCRASSQSTTRMEVDR